MRVVWQIAETAQYAPLISCCATPVCTTNSARAHRLLSTGCNRGRNVRQER